jgi:hypothetical protein
MPQFRTREQLPQPDQIGLTAELRYIAIGVPLGRWSSPGDTGAAPAAIVRQGDQFLLVDLGTFEVFLSAISPRQRSELVMAAEEAGFEDPVEPAESMIQRGLLVPFGNDPGEDLRQLRDLRLQPIGIGLGDLGTEPGSYRIARHDLKPLLECDAVTYSVWAASDGRSLGTVSEQIGSSYGVGRDEVLRHLIRVLPGLVESGAAFLDLTPRGDDGA